MVQRYGCVGCHEIAGLEDEGRIGTELTKEGSKPLEQFDFGLFVREAREKDWYSHRGFFEHKLQKPELFDEGMKEFKPEGEDLRMPNFDLKPQEITALSTFLMGAVDTHRSPGDTSMLPEDYRKDVQDGWWLVKKYNCMGCHQFKVGQTTAIETLPRFQTPEWKEKLPPKLLTEGARVSPDWLPSSSQSRPERDGHGPQRRPALPLGAHADVLLFARRSSETGAILPGDGGATDALHSAKAGIRCRTRNWRWRALFLPAALRPA